jgi:hypothetical protein
VTEADAITLTNEHRRAPGASRNAGDGYERVPGPGRASCQGSVAREPAAPSASTDSSSRPDCSSVMTTASLKPNSRTRCPCLECRMN